MATQKKKESIDRLKNEFEKIQDDNKGLDISKYLATKEDLPELGEIQIYDYQKDLDSAQKQATEIMESLVDLYIGGNNPISDHRYIKNKKREDALVYAETLFLSKMTRKNFLTQLRQIDNGDSSARMHEIVNQTVAQIRENSKFTSTQRTELEKFWKELRKDLGLNEISEQNEIEQKINEPEKEVEKKIYDTRNLNNMIDDILKKRP